MLTINHPELGLVQLRVRSTAKRQIIRVKPNLVIITVPPGFEDSVFPLPQSTIDSIVKIRNKVISQSGTQCRFEIGVPLETFTFTAQFSFQDNPKIRSYSARLKDGILDIKIPLGLEVESDIVQNTLLRILHKFLRQEAENILPLKIKKLSMQVGLPYRSVKIDTARSRWGCCSSQKDIKLSFYLMLLPERLIDYVIVHELCHTKEMNHGPKFKALLHSFFQNYLILEKEKIQWDYKVSWLKNNI